MTQKSVHEFEYRIPYADTDRLGVVYYANYLVFFERGRTELMRSMGIRYRDLEEKEKIYLPVSQTECRYLAPARYDDLIQIKTWISAVGAAHVDFSYEIVNRETGEKVASGYTRHPIVNERWKPVRIPLSLRGKLKVQ